MSSGEARGAADHGERREVEIFVEGTPFEWTKSTISYKEVVTLFDPTYPQHPQTTYAVTYKHGPADKPDGILAPGASVKVKNRMEFHVSPTGQS